MLYYSMNYDTIKSYDILNNVNNTDNVYRIVISPISLLQSNIGSLSYCDSDNTDKDHRSQLGRLRLRVAFAPAERGQGDIL